MKIDQIPIASESWTFFQGRGAGSGTEGELDMHVRNRVRVALNA